MGMTGGYAGVRPFGKLLEKGVSGAPPGLLKVLAETFRRSRDIRAPYLKRHAERFAEIGYARLVAVGLPAADTVVEVGGGHDKPKRQVA